MGRIDKIVQRHFDELVEQKVDLLIKRMEKLENTIQELKSELSAIKKKQKKDKEI